MKKQVLINVEDKDIRVAVLEEGQLSQLFVEQREEKSLVGNIYKGVVESIVPGLQAVFVDIGLERNAFLHFADVQSQFVLPTKGSLQHAGRNGAPKPDSAETLAATAPPQSEQEDASPPSRRPRPVQRRELRVGQELLVQVTKEPIDSKGARLTNYPSLPGRYLVLLPFSEHQGGVSRRIEDTVERKRLRNILRELKADEGSFIIRTAGLSQTEDEISSDVRKLQKIWKRIQHRAAALKAPALVHDEHEILWRLVRDELTEDVDEIVIDSKPHASELRLALTSILPNLKKKVVLYTDTEQNLFEAYNVESQFQKALNRRVWLKSGGTIVIDETEALVAIDVNTGKFVGKGHQEDTIFKNNMEAAEAIARQLRLRDVGGIIVIDFVDMKSRENQKALVEHFKTLLKKDRAKTSVVPLNEYGLLQMTRKRVRQSLSRVIFRECPYCQGSGRVASPAQVWKNIKYEILRTLKQHPRVRSLQITVHPDIRKYLESEMLPPAREIANRFRVALNFMDDPSSHIERFSVAIQE